MLLKSVHPQTHEIKYWKSTTDQSDAIMSWSSKDLQVVVKSTAASISPSVSSNSLTSSIKLSLSSHGEVRGDWRFSAAYGIT